MDEQRTPEALLLQANGAMPNNPRLPVLLYRNALPDEADRAAACERLFTANGWPPEWRDVVYGFHHYHTTAHEALGCVAGHADLMLGGEGGPVVTLRAGDAVVLPAGVGHCQVSASPDFLLVGAYPPGQHWDLCRDAADAAALERIRTLPLPDSDPVYGPGGPLTKLWCG